MSNMLSLTEQQLHTNLGFFHASCNAMCLFISWSTKSGALLPQPACPIRTLRKVALNDLHVAASQVQNRVFCGWKWWIRGLVFTVCLWQEDTAQEVITSKSIDMEICRLCLSPWLIIRFIIELLSLPSLWHVTQVPGHTWNSTLRMTGRGGIGRLTEIGQTIHIIISWERKAQGWMGWRRRMRVGWT